MGRAVPSSVLRRFVAAIRVSAGVNSIHFRDTILMRGFACNDTKSSRTGRRCPGLMPTEKQYIPMNIHPSYDANVMLIVASTVLTGACVTMITGSMFHWIPLLAGIWVGLYAVSIIDR